MKKIFIILSILLFCPIFILAVDKVEINTASLEQLDEITGIGPALAQRIIDARPFSSVDDLLRVKGIGPKTLQKIKDQGLACVNCAQLTQNSETLNPKSEANLNSQNSNIQNTTTPITYPSEIFINEILPNPEGSDETDELIELYNSNNFDVDLAGWKIQDTKGTATVFTVPQNTKILTNGFLVFKRPDTKIMLNNDEDGLNLFSPDDKLADFSEYTKAPLGQSYNKINSGSPRSEAGWQWSASLTPGAVNIITAAQAETSSKTLSKAEKSDTNNTIEAGLANISQGISQEDIKNNNPWFLFFTALAITLISAAAVLIIKFNFLKKKTCQDIRTQKQ